MTLQPRFKRRKAIKVLGAVAGLSALGLAGSGLSGRPPASADPSSTPEPTRQPTPSSSSTQSLDIEDWLRRTADARSESVVYGGCNACLYALFAITACTTSLVAMTVLLLTGDGHAGD